MIFRKNSDEWRLIANRCASRLELHRRNLERESCEPRKADVLRGQIKELKSLLDFGEAGGVEFGKREDDGPGGND